MGYVECFVLFFIAEFVYLYLYLYLINVTC